MVSVLHEQQQARQAQAVTYMAGQLDCAWCPFRTAQSLPFSWYLNYCVGELPYLHAAVSASAYYTWMWPHAGFTAKTLCFVTSHFSHGFQTYQPLLDFAALLLDDG